MPEPGQNTDAYEAAREEALSWLTANWDPSLPVRAWWARLADSGWGFPSWPAEWFGRGLGAAAANRARATARRPHAACPRQRRAEGPVPAGPGARRGGMVPVLLRARLGLGPGQRADPRGARQCRPGGRLDGQRAEGVDLGRAVVRPGHAAGSHRPGRAQAPRPELLRHRPQPARHPGQAAAPDERGPWLQRGVLHRRARR